MPKSETGANAAAVRTEHGCSALVGLGGDRVLIAASAPRTAGLIEDLGFTPVVVDISEFERAELARSLGVREGDPVTLIQEVSEIGQCVSGKCLDNRIGQQLAMEREDHPIGR